MLPSCSGIGAIAAEIPGLDQFRWPGYFLIISSAILAVIVLVCMREKWSDFARDDKYCHCSLNKIPVPLYVSFTFISRKLTRFVFLITEKSFDLTYNFAYILSIVGKGVVEIGVLFMSSILPGKP